MVKRFLNGPRGFTLIELLVVMAIIAVLVSLVAPKYFNSIDKAKWAAQETNARIIRESIDRYRADKGYYPKSLQDLVDSRYLRSIPTDPFLDRNDAWVLIRHPDSNQDGIYDIRAPSNDAQ